MPRTFGVSVACPGPNDAGKACEDAEMDEGDCTDQLRAEL